MSFKKCKAIGCITDIGDKNKSGFCKICYARDYRKRNKEKIKPVTRKKYLRRKDYFIKKSVEWQKKNGWPESKNPNRKINQLVRAKTRYKYPLKGNTCQFCSDPAEHRHHTTKPMEVDKFMFLCKSHHDEIHEEKCVIGEQQE